MLHFDSTRANPNTLRVDVPLSGTSANITVAILDCQNSSFITFDNVSSGLFTSIACFLNLRWIQDPSVAYGVGGVPLTSLTLPYTGVVTYGSIGLGNANNVLNITTYTTNANISTMFEIGRAHV